MAWPYGLPVVPSSLFFTITAFFPAYLPVRRMTTFPGCTGRRIVRRCVFEIHMHCQPIHSPLKERGPSCSAEDASHSLSDTPHRRLCTVRSFLSGKMISGEGAVTPIDATARAAMRTWGSLPTDWCLCLPFSSQMTAGSPSRTSPSCPFSNGARSSCTTSLTHSWAMKPPQ